MGSLATIGRYQPKNLIHLVLNNGVNESVGGQPSAGYAIHLTNVANSCGYQTIGHSVETKQALQLALKSMCDSEKPVFIDIHVRQGIRKDMPKLSIDHRQAILDLMSSFEKIKVDVQ